IWMNNSTIYIVASILIIIYAYQALQLISKTSTAVSSRFLWVKRIIYSFLVYFSLVLLILLVDLAIHHSVNEESYYYFTRFYYYPFFIGIAGLTYWIGLEGFSRRDESSSPVKPRISPDDLARLKQISIQVDRAMKEDKLYKNQQLTLNSLSEKLDIKPYLISKSLSEISGKRFNDYVNEYRVKEVQSLLQEADNARFTLLSLAMEAGFNSKSSFNRAVKKQLGITPNQLKSLQ
ncbi:MAG: helix-turn-helix transcriptional regulator, partial [Bacteroidota bacterium]